MTAYDAAGAAIAESGPQSFRVVSTVNIDVRTRAVGGSDVLLALGVSAAGERGDDLTFRVRDETAPAGGMVQMKVEDTDGTPISGGRPGFASPGVFRRGRRHRHVRAHRRSWPAPP